MRSRLQFSFYHSLLRVSAAVVGLVLLFESGLLSDTTARLSDRTELYLANAVGVYAGVSENPYNVLTTRIAELEQAVDDRDQMLRDRELQIGLGEGRTNSQTSTFILSAILFILLVLIILNYALDYLRLRTRYERLASSSARSE